MIPQWTDIYAESRLLKYTEASLEFFGVIRYPNSFFRDIKQPSKRFQDYNPQKRTVFCWYIQYIYDRNQERLMNIAPE